MKNRMHLAEWFFTFSAVVRVRTLCFLGSRGGVV